MRSEAIDLHEIIDVVRRNLLFLVATIIVCTVIALGVAMKLPKKYKAQAALNIKQSYFQHPLVNDLVADIQDPSELNSQRSSLLRLALNDAFIDKLGEEFGIYKYAPGDPLRAVERELLLARVEYFSLNPNTYQISVWAHDPQVSAAMTKAVLDQTIDTFMQERHKTLVQARDAVQAQAEAMSRNIINANTLASKVQPEVLRSELERDKANLAALSSRLAAEHPQIVALQSRIRWIESTLRKSAGDAPAKPYLAPAPNNSGGDAYADMLRKLANLNVVLDMEKDAHSTPYLTVIQEPAVPPRPYSPNKKMTLAFGAVAGLFLGCILVAYRELRRGKELSPELGAESFGVPLIGYIPTVERRPRRLMIEQTQPLPKKLPAPEWV